MHNGPHHIRQKQEELTKSKNFMDSCKKGMAQLLALNECGASAKLLIVSPHSKNLDHFFVVYDLINKSMLNINSS